jgi:hypothetical protein
MAPSDINMTTTRQELDTDFARVLPSNREVWYTASITYREFMNSVTGGAIEFQEQMVMVLACNHT